MGRETGFAHLVREMLLTEREGRPSSLTLCFRIVVLIQLLLPTVTTAGPDDRTAQLAQTRRELAEKFKGLTAYVRSPAKGLWTSPDGHTEHDDVVMVEVVTEAFDRVWWRSYSALLADRFRQDAIHVRALAVEMLNDDK